MEVSVWQQNSLLIDRIRKAAFHPNDALLNQTHILDLSPDGYIKPHIDSIKVCCLGLLQLTVISASTSFQPNFIACV